MASFSKIELSGSTDGRPIKVVATATAGTLIHTAQAGTGPDNYDEIWLWAANNHTANLLLTLEWGGVSSPDDLIQETITFKDGAVLIAPGWVLQNGLIVRAFAASANLISIVGYVNRITA